MTRNRNLSGKKEDYQKNDKYSDEKPYLKTKLKQ